MTQTDPQFVVKLAESEAELKAAQRLRYEVFVHELGAGGAMVDHENRLEIDQFDPFFDHLILLDTARSDVLNDQVIGVYRLLRDDQAAKIGQFYSEAEYDLTPLKQSGRKLLELGRSCLHADYRGGAAMFHLWNALAAYVFENEIEILFGVASFHGTDPQELAQPLSMLHHNHLAPEPLRATVKTDSSTRMDLLPKDQLDRKAAMLAVPALIKAYLRLGGVVGQGAYIDRDFNTIDVCLIMDTEKLNAKQRSIYTKGVAG
jgi:putative hemolysin